MAYKTEEEYLLEMAKYKVALLRTFLQDEVQKTADSVSDWEQGNHNAYEITLDLLNTYFKEDK